LVVYQHDTAEGSFLPKSLWFGTRYDASSKGTNLLHEVVPNAKFDYPKSLYTVCDMVGIGGDESDCTLDFFAGSGTTAHAVISLNREEGEHRKYILVEMGDYFDTVLKPRIERVIYSKDWKNGKPVSREGSSHMFKYMTLESYDDTLANLELKPEGLFEGASQAHEQYTLRYMLDAETQASPSLLNTAAFDDPSAYTLKVTHGSETVETAVDLVETFNYLIGLRVRKADLIRGIRVVQGVSPTGERVLVLWRNVRETNADQLNDWFTKQGYNTRDTEFDVIYVNGDNHLQNLRRPDQTWKVRLIEPEFQRLMFDVQDA
jgi:adenine-specific DNA-methyltransferase